MFTTAAGVHGAPLAEFALFGLLYFAKDLPLLARHQAARHWERHATALLRGSRVLLVGLGGVGREVARLLAAVGVEVYGAGRPGRAYQVPGVSRYLADTEIGGVLGTVDALVLACPLTERTRHLIGRRELALLRAGRRGRQPVPRAGDRRERADRRPDRRAGSAARASTCSRPSRCRPPPRCGRWTT